MAREWEAESDTSSGEGATLNAELKDETEGDQNLGSGLPRK